MNIKNFLKMSLGAALLAASQISCIHDDKWDVPEIVCNNKFAAPTMTMADVVALAPAAASNVYTGTAYKIPAEDATHPAVIFDGYVVSSDENGNFYKTITFQDKPENPTVGLTVGINKSMNYTDYPVGAHIRIKANGMLIGKSSGAITLGVEDPNYAIGRIPESIIGRYISGVCNGAGLEIVNIVPREITLDDIKASNSNWINTLVKVKNVQFTKAQIGKPLVGTDISGNNVDTDRTIVDANGKSATIRTGAFFKPAAYQIPNESGDITFVLSRYNATFQGAIRGVSDINFKNARFAEGIVGGSNMTYSGSFTENFESYPANTSAPYFNNFPKYLNYAFTGKRYWEVRSFSGNKYIQLSANGGDADTAYDTYFMVPVDFTAANTLAFNVNAGFYNGAALKVYTTTDYTPGTEITAATLNEITSNFTMPTGPASGYGTFAPAGTYDFPTGLTGNGFIVFKYEGNSSGIKTTMQLDEIKVQ
ncbi:DUF5689 domain-containing protein [Chryseobacterium sp. SSA4.19]|uniref:DUF5689 domain-containing protein n=1 Tax=Chryseobacterium sp. SSA4.19 TaxID=2919915 RepID=UPI001F4E0656|nr:DUF5689 domain-containing protein [Chryseobacterium sp. SSA4.19]MCJ8152569.1 DUF5689 domain-containing protein [Chryseobacterium sp. SSA4.19]